MPTLPRIIQGGMGAGVSGWLLARAVSRAGQLGVVAGTALDVLLVRRLQLGDPGGHLRRALQQLPVPGVAQRILARWYVPGGKPARDAFKATPMLRTPMPRSQEELIVAANFVEVFLAREGHRGQVGINYLEKIQLPILPSLFGAMLAGVDFVLMGAGIPRAIPGALDRLAKGREVEMRMDVAGSTREFSTRFEPRSYLGAESRSPALPKLRSLKRPGFIAIVASAAVATILCRKSTGRVDGFVIEGPSAGGHNAPPRGPLRIESGEPVYGERDLPDLPALAGLGHPFWLAGSQATPQRLQEALEVGAAGVQVGTAFAYCEESGLAEDIKRQVLRRSRAGEARVRTDPWASPTGFPFKVLELPGSHSEEAISNSRTRICDLGFLRHAYQRPDGKLGWRCAGGPVENFVRQGGAVEATTGKKCVCNGLLASVHAGQVRDGVPERPLVTSGDDVATVARFLRPGRRSYRAADVIRSLLSRSTGP